MQNWRGIDQQELNTPQFCCKNENGDSASYPLTSIVYLTFNTRALQFYLLQYHYMSEEGKTKHKIIKAVLRITKTPNLDANHESKTSDSRSSTKTSNNTAPDFLNQAMKNFSIAVNQLIIQLNSFKGCLNANYIVNQRSKQSQMYTQKQEISCQSKQPSKYFQKKILKSFTEIDERDRRIEISADGLLQEGKYDQEKIELWIAKVCQEVFSSAFLKFQRKRLSIQQAKVYCSQNIINNIVDLCLSQQQILQQWQLKIIDEHIRKEICPYMLQKYPMTETNVVNKTLQNLVKQVDNIQCQKNNIFFISSEDCFGFQYRQSGNYNDLIMKFVNHLIGADDEVQESHKSKSAYQEFQDQMASIFNSVYQTNNASFESQKKIPTQLKSYLAFDSTYHSTEQQKKQKVKQKQNKYLKNLRKRQNQIKKYSSLVIGQKISENVSKYSDCQITNMEFEIKDPSILRTLTKWCIELQAKFDPDYFLNNFDCFFSSKGRKVITLNRQLRELINQELKTQGQEIAQYLKKIEDNKYKQQSSSLKGSIATDIFTNMDKTEQCCGLFAVDSVSNLHTYVILYLNRLIHGLLRVSKNVYESSEKLRRYDCLPNLLSFTICDLMRCRISSKEQEIRRVYSLIMKKSEEEPSLLKVVQVKNRLKMNTNDIQINFLFKQKYLCQMQLAVNSEQSHFIQCSNKFNHFIYQLKRSIFGPISELCSIRKSLDSRSKTYERMAQKVSLQRYVECISESKNHEFLKQTQLPFKCSQCGKSSQNLNCFKPHLQCQLCSNYWVCGRCQLRNMDEQTLKSELTEFIEDKDIIKGLKLIQEYDKISDYGLCFSITQKVKKMRYFAKVKYRKKKGIYIQTKQDQIQQYPERNQNRKEKTNLFTFIQFNQKNSQQTFRRNNIIFEIQKTDIPGHQNFTNQQLKQQFLKKLIQSTYTKKKEQICIMGEKLTTQQCEDIMGSNHVNQKEIRLIDLTQNKLTDLSFLVKNNKFNDSLFIAKFRQLHRLYLNRNSIKNFKAIQSCENLETLFIDDNNLSEFPREILKLKKLKKLSISKNNFDAIPQAIDQLSYLEKLVACNLHLKELPHSTKKLARLKFVILTNNQFTSIPQVLNISSVQLLALNCNKITEIEDWVCDLPNLAVLQLNYNRLSCLPVKISNMKKLQKLILKRNNMGSLKEFRLPQSMKFLDASQNKLTQMDDDVFRDCKDLDSLNLLKNQLTEFPYAVLQHQNLLSLGIGFQADQVNQNLFPRFQFTDKIKIPKNLKYLHLSGYKIEAPQLQQLKKYAALQQLQLSKMQLEALPEAIKNMKSLTSLSLSSNQLTELNEDLFEKLSELRNLNLQDNLLETLPESIRNCRYLGTIYLARNHIAELDLDLEKLRKLRAIYIKKEETINIYVQSMPKQKHQPYGSPNNNLDYKNALDCLNEPIQRTSYGFGQKEVSTYNLSSKKRKRPKGSYLFDQHPIEIQSCQT